MYEFLPSKEEVEKNILNISEEYDMDPELLEKLYYENIEVKNVFLNQVNFGNKSASLNPYLVREFQRPLIRGIIEKDKNGKLHSIKPQNIKFDLKFLLEFIGSVGSMMDSNKIKILLAVLTLLVKLFGMMIRELSDKDAVVLLCIRDLTSASPEKIVEYAKEQRTNDDDPVLTLEDVKKSLKVLEKMKTIELIDGEYYICERINLK